MEFSKISLASQKFIPAFMLYMLVDVCDNHPLTIRLSVFKYLRECALVFVPGGIPTQNLCLLP